MKVLFVHTNFPAQFVHLAQMMAARGDTAWAIGGPTARASQGVDLAKYKLARGSTPGILAVRRGLKAMRFAASRRWRRPRRWRSAALRPM
jgi:hypothetical protein